MVLAWWWFDFSNQLDVGLLSQSQRRIILSRLWVNGWRVVAGLSDVVVDLFGELWAIGSKNRLIRIYKWGMEELRKIPKKSPFFYI